jgi:putative ABC transport system substrate-binding protein
VDALAIYDTAAQSLTTKIELCYRSFRYAGNGTTGGAMTIAFGRREFIIVLGAAIVWPLAGRPQQRDRMRRISALMGIANDAEMQARIMAFERGLEDLGWTVGRDLRIEYRFAASDIDRMRTFAKELVELQPDVILAHSTPVVAALLQVTRTVPIVFVVVGDPVGSGFVASVPRPGGNVTGFTNQPDQLTGKLLSILKEITPWVVRVTLMFNPDTVPSGGSYYLNPFKAAAPSFAVEPIAAHVRSEAEIERAFAALARKPGSGLIIMPDNFTALHRELIISLAARYRLPTIYPYRYFAEAGGLISYGIDATDLFRRGASYIDRILKGAKPADLPVQAPTKYEFVINLKTARALGLTVPRILLAGADAVIE